ncbi:MAG: M20 family peptidase [Clostridia bacterium]|nr:M20 family peptidase [Clostridia bacterium]
MEKYLSDMIKDLQVLIAINSVLGEPAPNAPFGKGVRDALDFALKLTKDMGFITKDIDGYIGYAEVGSGELFGVLTHLDTVPFGENWTFPPTSGSIVGGKLYGRGTEDDKGPFIASLYALKSLLDEGLTPQKRIRLIFGCNEETGWKCMDRYLETEEIPVMAFSPDGNFPVINCEKGLAHYELSFEKPDCLVTLKAGDRANVVPDYAEATLNAITDVAIMYAMHHNITIKKDGDKYKISAKGKSVHGSTPQKGENALVKVLQFMLSLDAKLAHLGAGLSDYNGKRCNLGLSDEVSGLLTINAGYAKTDNNYVKIGLDIRYPVSFSQDEITKRLTEYFDFAKVSLVHSHNSLYIPADNPLVKILLSAYNEITGENAQPITIGGATYARALPQAVAFGSTFPDEEGLAHQIDECITIENFVKMAKIYRLALKKLCF